MVGLFIQNIHKTVSLSRFLETERDDDMFGTFVSVLETRDYLWKCPRSNNILIHGVNGARYEDFNIKLEVLQKNYTF